MAISRRLIFLSVVVSASLSTMSSNTKAFRPEEPVRMHLTDFQEFSMAIVSMINSLTMDKVGQGKPPSTITVDYIHETLVDMNYRFNEIEHNHDNNKPAEYTGDRILDPIFFEKDVSMDEMKEEAEDQATELSKLEEAMLKTGLMLPHYCSDAGCQLNEFPSQSEYADSLKAQLKGVHPK